MTAGAYHRVKGMIEGFFWGGKILLVLDDLSRELFCVFQTIKRLVQFPRILVSSLVASKFSMGVFWGLNFGPGIFWGFVLSPRNFFG